MLSKLYKSIKVDCRFWLHVPSGTPWSTSSDTHQVVEIQKETFTQMYTPFLILKRELFNRCVISLASIRRELQA